MSRSLVATCSFPLAAGSKQQVAGSKSKYHGSVLLLLISKYLLPLLLIIKAKQARKQQASSKQAASKQLASKQQANN